MAVMGRFLKVSVQKWRANLPAKTRRIFNRPLY